MACYVAPLAGALVCYCWRKSASPHPKYFWLNLLLAGGSIFGVVDHWWNNELLAFSVPDLALGLLITAAIFAFWGVAFAIPSASAATTKSV